MESHTFKHDILQDEYNAVPYQSFPFRQTHPSHLYTIAKLFGLNPHPIETARVLELGCASGGNLLPMAFHYPQAEFLGIDLAEKQIEDGLKHINELNCKNITLRHQSILDFDNKEGKFDYIICHGVYSWVDQPVKEKILSICRENLNPNGIAYISYNTFPGWNMINSIRDLMMWHTHTLSDPTKKAQQARSILKFLVDGLQQDTSPYAQVLRNEINLLSKQADNYLLHDHLSTYNSPIYFYQFMEQANKFHLAYLSDAFLATMFTDNLPPSFANELKKINNIVIAGQYMDFIRNQRFRCTLLCQEGTSIQRALKTGDIEQFYLQFMGKCEQPNFSKDDIGKEAIKFSNGALTLSVRHPISQLAMLVLVQEQAKPIHYKELCEKIHQLEPSNNLAIIEQYLNNDLNLMRMVFAGLINITSYPANYSTDVPAQPIACPLARYQAQHQHWVTNRRHQSITLDPVSKILLPLLDGTNNITTLETAIKQNIEKGALNILDENKQPLKDAEKINKNIHMICEKTLQQIAKQALLINS